MKKRILSLALVAVMALSLAFTGCGGSGEAEGGAAEGGEPEINDTETYDNDKLVVLSYLCAPVSVDKDNYKEIVIDSGYYTEAELQ